MNIELKGNFVAHDRRLGRIPELDPRSKKYPIRKLLAATKPRSYTWECPTWLNQGQEGSCVGFAFAHEAIARPVRVQNVTGAVAREVYHSAQLLDQWPGEEEEGTSVLGGAKACVKRGWYKEYRWAFSLDDVIMSLGYHGPVVLGVDWYEGMIETDSKGFVRREGDIAGGHAILACGVNLKRKIVRLHNSWGQGWGINGDCFISFDDLDKLLIAQGEACVPLGRQK